jgi:hypothetical protein
LVINTGCFFTLVLRSTSHPCTVTTPLPTIDAAVTDATGRLRGKLLDDAS